MAVQFYAHLNIKKMTCITLSRFASEVQAAARQEQKCSSKQEEWMREEERLACTAEGKAGT
ncbi:hypothetical protein [Pontibacter brevis]